MSLKKRVSAWYVRRAIKKGEVAMTLQRIFGVNYKTTMGGWGMILGGIAGLIHIVTGSHPETNVTGAPVDPVGGITTSIGSIVGGISLIMAKDHDTQGTGDTAIKVDAAGTEVKP